jgi:hypothetical protein
MVKYERVMKYLFIHIFILVYCLNAQEYGTKIHGYVFDESTGEPIENVNVYIANSTWGSSTNSEGYYSFIEIPPGGHELVVTIIGYEYETRRLLLEPGSENKFDFQLKAIIYETETTVVEGSIPEEWLEDLEFFKQYFIGSTDFADQCVIENKEVLDFHNPYDHIFEASALQPLVIQNNALGYQLECVLIKFAYSNKYNTYSWSVKPRFTDLESANEDQITDWEKNRLEAFEGSVYHFLRSFKDHRLPEEKFDITRVLEAGQKVPRGQWRTILVEYDEYTREGYYPGETILQFDHFLHVVFDKTFVSWIGLNYSEITLDELGNPQEESPFVVYGEWSKHGIANLLPKNYKPDD